MISEHNGIIPVNMIKNKKIAVFGASGGGRKIYQWIRENHLGTIEYFIDNSEIKNHTWFEGVEVLWAEDFFRLDNYLDYYIVVASVYQEAMRRQLAERKIPWEHILNKAILAKWKFDEYTDFTIPKVTSKSEDTLVFDLDMGFCLGGVETWSYNLAETLIKRKIKCVLLTKETGELPPRKLQEYCRCVSGVTDFFDFQERTIQLLINGLTDLMPCTVLLAQIDNLYIAAHFIKNIYPDSIKLVSVIHGGLDSIFQSNIVYREWCDKIFCVSIDARNRLIDHYSIDKNKVFFKETPVVPKKLPEHQYTLDEREPLKLAYAARLEKLHKRSELIMNLIENLENYDCNYSLDIAGDGELFDTISEWVTEHNLEEKVKMLGRLPYDEMSDFWNTHDIMLNVSECEGCCVAMLEAMAYGAVPVLTDVYSVKHFITNGVNGYITKINDMEQMAEMICMLDNQRDRLPDMGKLCIEIIKRKCSIEDYAEYFVNKLI